MVLAKIGMAISLVVIIVQDLRDHRIWWFIFPVFAAMGSYLFLSTTFWEIYVRIVGVNAIILASFFLVLFTYIRVILKKKNLTDAFGLGDVLLYIGLMVSFPTITFVLLLLILPVFALVLNQVLGKGKVDHIPLAGYIGIFLLGLYIAHWMGFYDNLYAL